MYKTDESQHGILKQNFLSVLSKHVGHLAGLKGKSMQQEIILHIVCGSAIVQGLSWVFLAQECRQEMAQAGSFSWLGRLS